ncbi:MAG: hypothetical protein JWM57_562 [Phycisphaerales bacterium]|nr:hypothetical protein [Phycisphaerales bacterium]
MDWTVSIIPPVILGLQTPNEWSATRSKYEISVLTIRGITYAMVDSDMFGDVWWFDMAGRLIWHGSIHDPDDRPAHLTGPSVFQPREQWSGIVLAIIDVLLRAGASVYHVAATKDSFWFRRSPACALANRVIAVVPAVSKVTWAVIDRLADGTTAGVCSGKYGVRAGDSLVERVQAVGKAVQRVIKDCCATEIAVEEPGTWPGRSLASGQDIAAIYAIFGGLCAVANASSLPCVVVPSSQQVIRNASQHGIAHLENDRALAICLAEWTMQFGATLSQSLAA